MIIFDLDGTLADCEHRRHFVDIHQCLKKGYIPACNYFGNKVTKEQRGGCYHKETGQKWKPDWKSFYELCDQDKPIEPVISTIRRLSQHEDVQIWSGRCESVREKTVEWFDKYIPCFAPKYWFNCNLRMRPIGDTTPDDQLKERWLDDYLDSTSERQWREEYKDRHPVDFVFDDRPKVIRMWRRRGIFVFNCCQHDNEF